jgi:hypothetical protein
MTLRQDEREQGVRAHRQQRNRSWGWVLGLVVLLALLAGIFAYGTDPTRMALQTDRTTGQGSTPPANPLPPGGPPAPKPHQ